jgi:exonuclease VII large subunit
MKTKLLFFALLVLPAVLLPSENVNNKGNGKAETKIVNEIDRFYAKHEGDFEESAKTRFKNKYNELIELRLTKFRQLNTDLKNGTMNIGDYKKERIKYLQDQEEELKVEGSLLQFCCLKIKKKG